MFSIRLFLTVISVLSLVQYGHALYDRNARTNLALYWGQGGGQQRLSHFCEQTTVDIIPIGFIHIFPDQGNGFPGSNFANQCWGGVFVYPGPGPNPAQDQLQSQCPQINADIPVCQNTHRKKIILSLGGGTNTYQLSGAANGEAFADFLWGAFGPQTPEWLAKGLPRPFDGPAGEAVEVDGFDFDIEIPSPDSQAGYIAMGLRLREHFKTASKKYILTGAPQCVVIDANMGALISQVQFDIIWVQYYNTPQCSARNWINANPNFATEGSEHSAGFSYNKWARFIEGTASANAKLYIGIPGSPDPGNFYLSPDEISSLVKAYFCKENFGGVMIWEATSAENNPQGSYFVVVKNILTRYSSDSALPCWSPSAMITPRSTSASVSLTLTSSWVSATTEASITTTFVTQSKNYTSKATPSIYSSTTIL